MERMSAEHRLEGLEITLSALFAALLASEGAGKAIADVAFVEMRAQTAHVHPEVAETVASIISVAQEGLG